jgi:major type 1 subunit fimbrin (pilin)
MKNIKLASALAIAMSLAAAGTTHAADGGTMFFHGVVNDTTCTIQGGAGTDGGQNNFSVTLDGVATSELNQGKTAKPKAFQILVGGPDQGSCGADGNVIASMSFLASSPQVSAATGNLTNVRTSETTAEVQLLKDDGATAIDLRNPASGLQPQRIVDNQATLTYYARYAAPAGAGATPGMLETNVVYQVVYN